MIFDFFSDGVFQICCDPTHRRYATIGLPRCTLSQWQDFNPILHTDELGFITDTKEFVRGNGLDNFNDLPRYKFVEVKNECD